MIDPERVREAMRKRGYSQASLAREAGISAAAIQQILNGSSKRSRALTDIARALDVSAEWLEGRVEPKQVALPVTMDVSDFDLVAVERLFLDRRDLDDDDKKMRQRVYLSRSWLRDMVGDIPPEQINFVTVGVDSMSPTIQPGDEICVKLAPDYDESHHSIWIVLFRGQNALARLRPETEELLHIFSDNPVAPAFSVRRDEVSLIGRVVWHSRYLGA